ncbi:MAG: ribosomal RNA small subunit methyltransferase A, partial [Parcubacteria group bacterium]|nr:ribosomal RNA small subunit methyltransferase A [Parcubacteria group bacterium]
PEPKVDSAIIVIENISGEFFKNIQEDLFFKLVKAGFASKRKKVLSNIKKQFPNVEWEKIFTNASISLNARAENIPLSDWKNLYEYLTQP